MTTDFRYHLSDIDQRYDIGRALTTATVDELTSALRFHAPPHVRRVLDLGCGTGRFTRLLADTFNASVIAIEPAGNMLATAVGKKLGEAIQFVRGSAVAIPVAADAFDLVFISQVLHHLPDLAAAMAEIRRVLASGGCLFVRQATRENLDSYFYQQFFPQARLIDERRLPTRERIIAAAQSAGLWLNSPPQTMRIEAAGSSRDYVAKIATRSNSDLEMISDEEFAQGMRAFALWAESHPDQAWVEEVDHIAFTASAVFDCSVSAAK